MLVSGKFYISYMDKIFNQFHGEFREKCYPTLDQKLWFINKTIIQQTTWKLNPDSGI